MSGENKKSKDLKIPVILPLAGKGERFYPLTKFVPKEVLPIVFYRDKDKYHKKNWGTPILEANIYNLSDIAKEFIFVINKEKENLLNYIYETIWKKYKLNHDTCKIVYQGGDYLGDFFYYDEFSSTKKMRGDGFAVYLCIDYDNKRLNNFRTFCYLKKPFFDEDFEKISSSDEERDDFLVHYGDLVINHPKAKEQLKKALKLYHTKKQKNPKLAALILTYPIKENPSRFGILSLEKENDGLYKVKEIVEKPKNKQLIEKLKQPKGWYINSGISIINKTNLLPYFKSEYKKLYDGKIKEMVLANIFSNALKGEKDIYAFEIEGVEDLGTFKDWLEHYQKNIKNIK